MKKNILIIIGILFSLSLFAGAGQNREGKPWTVMVYIVADNSLGGESDSGEITGPNYAVDNINQMLEIGDTRNFNLVLMYDGPNFKLNKDSKTTYEPGYYYIENGKFYLDPKNQPVSKDSGNVATLKGFVEYAKVNYPAEHYCLSLWNHGGGVDHIKQIIMAMGICYDKNQQSYNPGDKGFEDFISDRQLVDMLNDVYSDSKLDILIEDACMMQMAALNYELKNSVNFVCASEAREGDGGCDYSEMLKIFTLPGFNTKKTKEIASYFVISQKTNEGLITFSAVDLKQMYNGEKFNGLFSRFSTSLYSKVEGAPKNKKAALAQKTILEKAIESLQFGDDSLEFSDYIDLGNFAKALAEVYQSDDAIQEMDSYLSNKNGLVLSKIAPTADKKFKSASGISVYFGTVGGKESYKDSINNNYYRYYILGSSYESIYEYNHPVFCSDFKWFEMLKIAGDSVAEQNAKISPTSKEKDAEEIIQNSNTESL